MTNRPPILYLAAAVAAYLALWLLVPKATFLPAIAITISNALPFVSGGAAVALDLAGRVMVAAPMIAFMAIQIAMVYFLAQIRFNFRQSLMVMLGCIAGVVGLIALIVWQSGIAAKLGRYPTPGEHLIISSYYYGPLKMPIILLTIFAAASIGYLVSLRVSDKNLLLPVVMFAAYIDFWTVTQGPVSVALKKAPRIVEAVSAPIPQAGTGAFVPSTLIGPGDFLFMGLVFAAAHRLKMNGPRNYWFIFGAMTLGMTAVMTGLVESLPALVTLAVAVVAANWREFKLTRQEAVSMGVVAVLLLGSLPLVWSLLAPKETREPADKPTAPVTSPARK